MALDESTISIPFVAGIDTKTDPKQVPAGELLALENATFKTLKEIRKRNGYAALGNTVMAGPRSLSFSTVGGTITAGSFIADFKDEILVGDGTSLYSYSNQDDAFSYRGRLHSARMASSDIFQNEFTQVNPDSAVNTTTNYTLYASESWSNDPATIGTYLGINFCIKDNNTGQVIYSSSLADTTSRPRCVAISSVLYLIYFDSADNSLHAVSVGSTSPGAASVLVSNIDPTLPNYDVAVFNSLIYVAYNGTGSTVKVASFSSALAAVANISKAEIASNGICLFNDNSNNVWVGYNNGADAKAFIVNSSLSTTQLAPTVIESSANTVDAQNITGVFDGTRGIFFYDKPNPLELNATSGLVTSSGFVMPAVGATVIGVGMTGTDAQVAQLSGQIIYIETAGYFYMSPFPSGGGGITVFENLGYPGNAAPGAAIASAQAVTPTLAYSNASVQYNTLTLGGSVGSPALFMKSVALSSRAYLYGGIAHVVVCHDSKIEPTFFLTSLYNIDALSPIQIGNVTAKIFESSAGGIPNKSCLTSANIVSSGIYSFALAKRKTSIEKTFGNNQIILFFNNISEAQASMAPTQISKKVLGNNLHIASGALEMYDGQRVVEHGFHLFPHFLSGVINAGAGSLSAGTYGYKAVYEWIDAQGQTHRSAPSPTFSITVAVGDGVTLTIPNLRVTQKPNVTITLYRTQANGTIYFRQDTNNTAYPYENSILTNYSTIPDVSGDAEIAGNEQLYTNGEVENIASPSPIALGVFKNRLTVVPADEPTTYWYSKQVVPGSPVEMSDLFFQNSDQASGNIVGLAQMDDKNILFKDGNVYYVVGSGPSPSGGNNDLTDPTLIATDVGLVDMASIVLFPFGLMFKSKKGIYILDRSLQVNYIGAKVEAYNSLTVVSGSLAASSNQVRFILSSGQALVFDYFVNTWSVFTNQAGVDAMFHENLYYFLKSDGTVMEETPGVFSDNGSFISMKMVTSWLGLAGLQGFQRVKKLLILGEYLSAHDLSVSFAYDFDSSLFQTTTVSPTSSVYQFRVNIQRQKCESIQVTIQDVSTGLNGESFALSALGFEAGIKRGLDKIGATKSYG